jgi:hypothetical protein
MHKRTVFIAVFCLFIANLTASAQEKRQLILVSTYQIENEEIANQFDSMMEAAVDAMSKYGLKHIGVFKLVEPDKANDYSHKRVVITPYDSIGKLLDQGDAFEGNGEFWNLAKQYLMAQPDAAPFKRIDTTLLRAFTGMPQLAVPGPGKGKKRLFELRTYESYSEMTGLIKVAMFNDGEIDLFEKVGLPAVFYGSAIAGGNLPQLTYMLVHDDVDAQKAGWLKFVKSPEWEALQKKDPYAGKKLVSKITKTMLVATDYSQIK